MPGREEEQNRLVIELACECLRKKQFTNVRLNRNQGTFPDVYITADRNGSQYLIGITGREEIGADGKPNCSFNLVRTDGDRKKARELAGRMKRKLAFVAVALQKTTGSYSAYFDELEPIGFPRGIRMLPEDRSDYELLSPFTDDARVKALSSR